MRVLIVDDCELSAGMLAVVLEVYGHRVRLTGALGLAVKMAREFQPQLVLLTVAAPLPASQLEMARQMRHGAENDLQILAICETPDKLSTDEHRAFDGVFARPVRFGQIKPFLDSPVHELPVAG